MQTKITAKLDLTTDASQPSAVVIMYKAMDDDTPLARFVLRPDGEWQQVLQSETMPTDIKIPVILEGE